MTEPRTNGTRAQVYAAAYDDPATAAAVELLVEARVPAYVAPLVVVTAVHRLDCWAIQDGDDGTTGHLTDGRLLDLAWPEHAGGPRSYGRGEKLGKALRAALVRGGYLTGSCSQCAGNHARILHASGIQTCSHEALYRFKMRHGKLLRDRRKWRERAAASREAAQDEAPDLARGPNSSRSHSRSRDREGPPSRPAPVEKPRQAPRLGGIGNLVADTLAQAGVPPAGAYAPVAGGEAAASSRPGAGWEGDQGREPDEPSAARQLLLDSEPNRREQVRHGRDLTLRPGRTYLFRLGLAMPGLAEQVGREQGRDPAPGRLLAAASPDRFRLVERMLASKLRTDLRGKPTHTVEGYARSMLADHWGKFLDDLQRQAEQRAELEHLRDRRQADGSGA